MSAKPCKLCGGIIVFGTEQETGKVLPLMVGGEVYRVVKDNIVTKDPKALIRHVCQINQNPPPRDRHFSEPEGAD